MADCVFCQIVKKQLPAHIVWEDRDHLAFLSIFPNTEGVTVIIPKQHHSSYIFDQKNEVINKLMSASKKVAKLLDRYFDDVGRCGVVFEGFGVNHLHAKLYPLHGTGRMKNWQMIESKKFDKFFPQYPGYICSNDSHRADDQKLAKLAAAIRKLGES